MVVVVVVVMVVVVVVVGVGVVVKPVLLDEVCHDHTGAHDHHGCTVSLILAFLATPSNYPPETLFWGFSDY